MPHSSYAGLFSPLPTGDRVVVDANVLLNAVFLPDGFARKALTTLAELGKTGIIDDSIDLECRRRIEVLATRSGLAESQRNQLFADFEQQSPWMVPLMLPGGEVPLHVRNALRGQENDTHVLGACVSHSAWLLTSDINLTIAATGVGIEVRTPWDVVAQAADEAADPVAMDYLFRFVAPARDQGFIFAHVLPGGWASQPGAEVFTVCDVGGLGSLFYEQRRQSWVFECFGSSIALKATMTPRSTYAVCATYKFPSERNGSISVYLGSNKGGALPPCSREITRPQQFSLSHIRYGATLSGDNAWFGHFRWVVIGPQHVNAAHFKNLLSKPNGIPDPHDWKMLELAVQHAGRNRTSGGGIQFPSERELVRYGRG